MSRSVGGFSNSGHLSPRAVVQGCLFEANSYNRVLNNQWLASLNFPVLGNLHQSHSKQLKGETAMRIAAAATLYFAIVFGVGFLLGPIRIFWLEPRLGLTAAAICEAPFLIAAMIIASRWVPCVVRMRQDLTALGLMGFGALALQQTADFAVGIGLRNLTPTEQLARFATAPGLIYAALLAAFAAMPLLRNRQAGGKID